MLSDKRRRGGFTLIEVAVCGAVLSFSVLTALAIIPRGLVVQNQARMRTVASATITYLAADAFRQKIQSNMDATSLTQAQLQWIYPGGRRSDDLAMPTSAIYRIKGLNTPTITDGRLERRVIFTFQNNGSVAIEWTAWLLNKDVTQTPTVATYLATYVEAM